MAGQRAAATAITRRGGLLALLVIAALGGHPPAATSAVRGPSAWRAGTAASGVRLAASQDHTCQVNGDGTVRCWGKNGFGQLGDGTTTDRSTPVTVSGIDEAVAIAVGQRHSCALIADGIVSCWGGNGSGQLGNGTTSNSPTPVTVSGITDAVALAAGPNHTCALLATGTVRCWGANSLGQLGDGTTTGRSTPVTVAGLSNATAITAGGAFGVLVIGDHTCALLASGTVSCWGDNHFGQLGDGTTTSHLTPVSVAGLTNVIAIAAGNFHTCAIVAGGTPACWGANSVGQLGDGTTTQSSTPVSAPGLIGRVAISAGASTTCTLLADGTAQCWGSNGSGQLGNGTTSGSATPVTVQGLRAGVSLAVGSGYSCAMLADDSAQCWGANGSGQLGNGTTSSTTTPTTVAGGGGSITARSVAAGLDHTCAVRSNATASCWGNDDFGQLGIGVPITVTPLPGTPPPPPSPPPGASPTAVLNLGELFSIAAGGDDTCAILVGGTVSCWGDNQFGQLGDGTTTDRFTPVAVHVSPFQRASAKTELGDAVALATGDHTCAVLATADVVCWGVNNSGELGDGTTTNRLTPVPVSGLSGAVAVTESGSHTCALLADGTVRCWGANDQGQLGDGTTTNRLTPVPVVGVSNAVAIAAGETDQTCALLADGTTRCWGSNAFGQLGDGTQANRTVPDTVVGLSNADGLTAGGNHTCAVVTAGNAYCWGSNASGELGDNTTTNRLTPTPTLVKTPILRTFLVAPLANVVQAAAGFTHTCSVQADGSLWCWGRGNTLGLGANVANQLTAAEVPSFTLNIDPTVALARNRQTALINVIATCRKGRRLHVVVSLLRGHGTRTASGNFLCAGRLVKYPVLVHASRHHRFSPGAAHVSANALIRQGRTVVDRQKWTRAVTLQLCRSTRGHSSRSCSR